MNTAPTVTSAEAGSRRAHPRAWVWPAMVIGLILMNAGIAGTTLILAMSDRSAAVEPDYYARALKYEDVVRQRGDNVRLGWRVTVRATGPAPGVEPSVVVSLATRDGVPLDGATVKATAFASARAADRAALQFEPQPGQPGTYCAALKGARPGQWRVHVHVERGPDVFTHECDVDVPAPAVARRDGESTRATLRQQHTR